MDDGQGYEQEILDFAYSIAEEASKMIIRGSKAMWEPGSHYDAKKNSVDLVTATDQAVEEMIKSRIKTRYPKHRFIGEETYHLEKKLEFTDDFTWVVDPIDGTMNFVHSFPQVACSIGVLRRKVPVVGVIALPFYSQIYAARTGGGAFMNRTIPLPLTGGRPQPLARLQDCLIGAEYTFGPKLNSFSRLAGSADQGVPGGIMCHALRTLGTSACNLVAVIAGQLDVYWDAGMWPWDVCAAMCILRETGGMITGGPTEFEQGASDEQVLISRRIVAVRAVAATKHLTGRDIQMGIVKELYDTVEPWTNANMTRTE